MASQPQPGSNTWQVAGGSVRGVSHVRENRPNQDALAKWPGEAGFFPATVIAIADGHGGARHFRSEIGSRLAVDITVQVLRELAGALDAAPDRERSRLAAVEIPMRIVAGWNAAARAHLASAPITGDELAAVEAAEGASAVEAVREDELLAYGATLLAALATERALVFTQLGDGDVLAVAADGTTTRPVPVDERLSGNRTTSLCRPGAESDFRVVAVSTAEAQPSLVLLSTDGYANSFKSDADFLQVGRDFLAMIDKDGMPAVEAELPGILEHASVNGSGDDITLGMLQRADGAAKVTVAKPPEAAATTPSRVAAAVATREVAKLEERLQSAEKRIGTMRAGFIAAGLVAAIALGYAMRDHLGIKLPGGAAAGKPAISGKVPEKGKTPPGLEIPPTADKPLPSGDNLPTAAAIAAAAAAKEPTAGDIVMGHPAHPSVQELVATRADRGIEVSAVLVFARQEFKGCTVEATVWGAKEAKLASAAAKAQHARTEGPSVVPVQILVPYKDDAKKAKAMKAKDAAASIAVSCDGQSVADSKRVPVDG